MRADYRFPPKPIDNPEYISVLIPTRARPEKLKKVFECFRATVENKHQFDVWLYVDDDDEITKQYIGSDDWRQYGIAINWHIASPTKSMGDMFNRLWQVCRTNPGVYFPFSDDYIIETQKWDTILRDYLNRYHDGIMLGFLYDPLHAPYQVTIPVPSAQWLNSLGYFITNRFYFWFDDMWLDGIADMVQRKVLIPIIATVQGGKGYTPRIRNLPFWNRYFVCTLDDRLEDAEKLLQVIYKDDQASLELALQKARESAAVHIHKLNYIEPDHEKNTEIVLSDPEHVPGMSKLLDYYGAEMQAVEDLLQKIVKSAGMSELSDVLFLLDALEFSSYNLLDINYIKATMFQEFGYSSSAVDCLSKHIKVRPDDVRSIALYRKLENHTTTTPYIKKTAYMSGRLGIADDYFIFFPSSIDEALYFSIQRFIYYAQKRYFHFNSILVVGAGNGEGTVHAIVSSFQDVNRNTLFCIEWNNDDFVKLENNYGHIAKTYNCSSVTTADYISEEELTAFYKYIPSVMNRFSLESFVSSLKSEKQYLETTNRSSDCIENIKRSHNLDRFGLVVLDGSLFSGEADLDAVYGSDFIFLTSINSVKDYANHKKLLEDDKYELLFANSTSRAGYSIFAHKGLI